MGFEDALIWLGDNVHWIFDGVGVPVVSGIGGLMLFGLGRLVQRRHGPDSNNHLNSKQDSPHSAPPKAYARSTLLEPTPEERQKYDPGLRKTMKAIREGDELASVRRNGLSKDEQALEDGQLKERLRAWLDQGRPQAPKAATRPRRRFTLVFLLYVAATIAAIPAVAALAGWFLPKG